MRASLSKKPCNVLQSLALIAVCPVRIEVHDVVPHFPHRIQVPDELRAIDAKAKTLPVVRTLQQPAIPTEGEVERTLYGPIDTGRGLQLFEREMSVYEIPQVPFDLADEEKRPRKLPKLFGQIRRRNHTSDGPVCTPHQHVPVFRDDAYGVEQPGGARSNFRRLHALPNVRAFPTECQAATY